MALTTTQKLILGFGVLCVLAGVFVLSFRASPLGREPIRVQLSSPTDQQSEKIVVHVSGAVVRPDLYELPAGSRVWDAVRAAGGYVAGADTAAVNPAEQLADGRQIVIPALPPQPPSVQAAEAEASAPSIPSQPVAPAGTGPARLVSINEAPAAELAQLPGIGPELAERIVHYRSEHGRFQRLDELQRVRGIGEGRFEQLKPHIRL